MKRDDYEIGYGKPPPEHKFKPGQSGNPAGRKKGSRGLKTDLLAELNAKETIKVGNKQVTDTRQRQSVRTLTIRAANGDLKAQRQLFALILQVIGPEDLGVDKERLSHADQTLLDEVLGGTDLGAIIAEAAAEGSEVKGSPENANDPTKVLRNGD